MTVIGIGGRFASGKDAIADYLVEHHGFVKLGMSDPLLAVTRASNPFIRVTLLEGIRLRTWPGFIRTAALEKKLGYVKAKRVKDYRLYMQNLGTEAGRDIHGEDVWANIAVRSINELVAEGLNVVITGIRFQNEVTMFDRVKGAETITVWVDRPSQTHPATQIHLSENSVTADDFQVTIVNDGTLEDLYGHAAFALNLAPKAEEPKGNTVVGTVGRQQVLIDGVVIMTLVGDAPNSPGRAIVESYATGPMLVDKRRLQPIA